MAAKPFKVSITEAEIADLRARLRRTRWPEREPVDDWSQGLPLAYAQELCRSWAEDYDFGFAERLNVFPQYRDTIDGLGIHFLHVRSPEPNAFPLVLTHGWPGSVLEFLEVLGPLTDPRAHGGDPADAFHVVAPSLPGYGWSDKPSTTGWGITRTARAWDALMVSLGYERYGAQGGDWGSAVSAKLGEVAPERVVGVHLNLGSVAASAFDDPTPSELANLEAEKEMQRTGRGYSAIQATRPQTLGYGLTDSPAGQGRLDRREVLGVDGQRRPSRGRVVPADDPRRDLGLLVHRVGHVVGAPVLGELRQLSRQGDRAIRTVGLPARHHPPVEAGGRAAVHRPALVRGAAAWGPLRRAGAAGFAGQAGARVLPPVPLIVRSPWSRQPLRSGATMRGIAGWVNRRSRALLKVRHHQLRVLRKAGPVIRRSACVHRPRDPSHPGSTGWRQPE
ncbi:pimeloyl-ACP methyl ester carboxylesterase [Streptomyces ambofaciens]